MVRIAAHHPQAWAGAQALRSCCQAFGAPLNPLAPSPPAGGTTQTSEQFNTAGRTIKTGLIANVIVSEWTWAATLLQR